MKKFWMILMAAVLVITAGCGNNGGSGSTAATGDSVTGRDVSQYITLGEYKGLDSGVVKQEVTDEMVDSEIRAFVRQYSQLIDVTDRTDVQMGDVASIDYVGTMDGVAFEGGTGSYDLEIGSGSFIPGFEEQLVGMQVGEIRDITVTFPDPYRNNPDFSGKDAVFTVTVKGLKAYMENTISDELVAAHSNYKTVDELTAAIRDYYGQSFQQEYDTSRETVLMEMISKNAVIKSAPEDQLIYYRDYYKTYVEQLAASSNMSLQEFVTASGMTGQQFDEWLDESAKTSAEGWLVYQAIAYAENLTVPESEVDALIEGYAAQQSLSAEEFMTKNGIEREEMRFTLLAQKVTEFVLANNK